MFNYYFILQTILKSLQISLLNLCEEMVLQRFPNHSSGVFNESYMQDILLPEFLFNLENNTVRLNEWKKEHEGKTPSKSLQDSVLEHVGRPVHALLR